MILLKIAGLYIIGVASWVSAMYLFEWTSRISIQRLLDD